MKKLKLCTNCIKMGNYNRGYALCANNGDTECPECGTDLIETNMSNDEAIIICRITEDWVPLLESMIKLHDEDIIEYNIKMGQLRAIDKQQLAEERRLIEEEFNKPSCPKCGSTEIQIVPRKWAPLTGILTNKTDRVCVNCKHKW